VEPNIILRTADKYIHKWITICDTDFYLQRLLLSFQHSAPTCCGVQKILEPNNNSFTVKSIHGTTQTLYREISVSDPAIRICPFLVPRFRTYLPKLTFVCINQDGWEVFYAGHCSPNNTPHQSPSPSTLCTMHTSITITFAAPPTSPPETNHGTSPFTIKSIHGTSSLHHKLNSRSHTKIS
jgi:hypothetical protein